MTGYSLTLYNSVKRGNAPLWNVTDKMKDTWRRSIRAVGGYWIGTADYTGTRDELLEMFLEGMAREIREDVGGLITWQGYISEMELVLDGVRYVRSMTDQANAVKVGYTRIGDNLLTNGGAESGAWTVALGKGAIDGTAAITQSATWINSGTCSCRIVSSGGVQGANVQGTVTNGYPITIAGSTVYNITGAINVTNGSWRISCNRADTGAALAFDSSRGAWGEKKIDISIPVTNSYAGSCDLTITSEATAGTIYADSFYFQLGETAAQTGWISDANSITEYGRTELSLLEAAMTTDAANAKSATTLKKQAWPNALPPSEFTLIGADMLGEGKDKLTLTVSGYVHTLANKYSLTVGTAAASAHVTSIIGEAEFVTTGGISSNTLQYQIDNRSPIRHWQILMDIIAAGDASGNRWVGGVYAPRVFDYRVADNFIAYRYRGGKFYDASGGDLEPWFAEPGHLLYLDDMPVGPTQISGNVEDDPHVVFVSEIEMGPPTDDYPLGTLTFRHEAIL